MNDSFNLLPEELQVDGRKPNSRQKKQAFMVIAACAVLLVGAWLLAWQAEKAENRLHAVEEELARLEPQLDNIEDAQERVERMEAEISTLQKISRRQDNWSPALQELSACLPRDVSVVSFNADGKGEFQLQGRAGSLASVGVFVDHMERGEYFDQVSLLAATKAEAGEFIEFNISGKVYVNGDK